MLIGKPENIFLKPELVKSLAPYYKDTDGLGVCFIEDKKLKLNNKIETPDSFFEYLDGINANKLPALFWINDKEVFFNKNMDAEDKERQPTLINDRLCFAVDGYTPFTFQSITEEIFQDVSITDPLSLIKPPFDWVLAQILDRDDKVSMIFLDINGKFTTINNFSKSLVDESIFIEYGISSMHSNGEKWPKKSLYSSDYPYNSLTPFHKQYHSHAPSIPLLPNSSSAVPHWGGL